MICPKCQHERTPQDDARRPDYECPACGIVYAKYNQRPPGRKKPRRGGFDANNITGPQAVIISLAVIALGAWLATWEPAGMITIGNDRPPELSLSDIAAHPEKLVRYKKELCAWAKREQAREPGIYNKARADSACKPSKR